MKIRNLFFLIIVLCIGFIIRIYGLNWDQGQHLHPDERFLTMVAGKIVMPSSLTQYFDSKTSPLNPYNSGFNFYVYGIAPLLITRLVGEIAHMTSYDSIFLVGRMLSALFDCGTIALVYFLSLKLFQEKKSALFAAFIYTFSVLPIQQSHFFTVDSFLVFFSTATLLFFAKYLKDRSLTTLVLSGVFFGLALSSKTSLIIVVPIFLLILAFRNKENLQKLIQSLAVFTLTSASAFRIFQPYAFDGFITLSPHFISNIREAHQMITGEINYPPNVQWTNTPVIFHPFVQILLWGFGHVASALAVIGLYLSKYKRHKQELSLLLVVMFASTIFIYQGVQLAKYMRYFYPIYPILAVFAGYALSKIVKRQILVLVLVALLIWPLSFLAIYDDQHSRVQASHWIYRTIPVGSTITSEEWDDSLPLAFLNDSPQQYTTLSLPMFREDSVAKWDGISSQLERTNYVLLTSNRVYDATPHRPLLYPVTNRYYSRLLDGSLGFRLIKEFHSYPHIGAVSFNDSMAEESFTVYDHPKVLIFKKDKQLSKDAIMKLLYTL